MRRAKILLIEDNEGDVILTKEGFEDSNIVRNIDVARDGMAGIEYLKNLLETNNPVFPDIILLDINLPKKNGQEVLQFIKGNDSLKYIPVIMLTTSSTERDIITSYNNYANCFISKPVEVDSYMSMISKLEDFWFRTATLPKNKNGVADVKG